MLPRLRKTMIATLVVAAALGLPGMAHASSPSVQVKLCNNYWQSGSFQITGLNQHDQRASTPQYDIAANQCRLIGNCWWKTGQTVSIAVRRSSLSVKWYDINSNERNGSTVTFGVN
ncbi:hypothetical protein OG205_16500 [Lentzea sp. NBC_00516]|uniref:hypothetical protein n=1 Tax=Lentzea sp. NBC_00516 TaxID=2903582 RepID=UPI002E816B9F|nr:hypothetical protein [Lentzea sp. NBC_00516]WUD28535.1 hypothetical protein OG205_16500 [Lentzea sp. NBC_00516]